MTDSDTTLRSVIIWVCEGTWRATVDAALSLAPAPARFTVLHVTSRAPADAARGAYLGLLGRGGRDPGARFDEVAAEPDPAPDVGTIPPPPPHHPHLGGR